MWSPIYHRWLLPLSLSLPLIAYGQHPTRSEPTIEVSFPDGYSFPQDEAKDRHSYLVPVRPRGDSINFFDQAYALKVPPYMSLDSVALADYYFSGDSATAFPYSALYLIYPYQADIPTVYVDTSDTFDFTEALVIERRPSDSIYSVLIPNSQTPDCLVNVEYRKVEWESEAWKATCVANFGTNGPLNTPNKNVDADYWLRSQRKNLRFTTFDYEGVRYRIGLSDQNLNGKYTDAEDRILFSGKDSILSDDPARDGYDYRPGMLIGGRGQAFRVVSIEACGSSLQLQPFNGTVNRKGLVLGGYLSDLTDTIIDSRIGDLKAHHIDKDYLLLDVWGSWCSPCLEAVPELKALATEHATQLSVIGLNVGDTEAQVEAVEARLEIPWPSWRLQRGDARELNIDGFPTYLLFDKQGKLISTTGNLTEIVEALQNDK